MVREKLCYNPCYGNIWVSSENPSILIATQSTTNGARSILSLLSYWCCCRYVAPEYASTGMLNERSDVYSFGVLIMEIITGRSPVDYTRAAGEVGTVAIFITFFIKNMEAQQS